VSLNGRIALVVGGVRGIGAAIAEMLDEAGAAVIVTSHAKSASSPTPFWYLDVRDETSIHAVADRLQREFGHLDVLVYNPGVAGPTKRLEEVTSAEWAEVLELNVTGLYRMCRATIPLLRHSDGGRIIAVSSMTGRRPLLHRVPYAASKTALMGFVRSLALELGPDGITVNTVSPGYVSGARIDTVIETQARAHGVTAEEMRARFVSQSPLHRMVTPQSVGRAVCFLADSSTQEITGTDINVTAGVWMD
jgi:NAD(P)-dependent dehydrogenase (short-subunit alcohol dehydrogenase family)